MEIIAELPLTNLNIGYMNLSSYEFIKSLTLLKELNLSNNKIGNIEPLTHLPILERLYLKSDYFGSPSFDYELLGRIPTLKFLDLSHTDVKDLSFISILPLLEGIDLHDTRIETLEPLFSLENLSFVDLPKHEDCQALPQTAPDVIVEACHE